MKPFSFNLDYKPAQDRNILYIGTLLICSLFTACSDHLPYEEGADAAGHSAPTPATIAANKLSYKNLPIEDQEDFDNARRGLIAQDSDLSVQHKDGHKIWSMPDYSFVKGKAANSVNPSLWRQETLNNIHGLFEVVPGIYQLRGFDLANMTLIKGDNSWIIVDPLTSSETASKAFSFAMQHLERKPVSAVLFTHSHIDHFGGINGILSHLSDEEKQSLRVIAPEGFMEEATSENLIAGPAMSRRAMFMYGKRLPRTERGHIGSGLGKGPAFGTFSIYNPTELISKTITKLTIDGTPFEFQFTPGSEAPAEFTFYLPKQKAFCGAELLSRNMHNLYTLRGAKVRDALAWSNFITEAMTIFNEAEVYFASHHWPLWGKDKVSDFLAKQRDTYKYIHDQSVRLMNSGLTPNEIAEQIKLPETLRTNFATRGYYGTLKHNAKAVYQAYLGWFTANPALLDPLPEAETAQRTLALMGGSNKVLAEAENLLLAATQLKPSAINKEYRWIAQLLNTVVFAEPDNNAAKSLLAKTYDQLGYLAESAPWRDFYLSGAFELRHGGPEEGISPAIMKEILLQTPVEKFFDSMAVNLNGPEAEGTELIIEINFTDLSQRYLLTLENSVLHHRALSSSEELEVNTKLSLTRALFIKLIIGEAGLNDTLFSDDLNIEGSKLDLISFFSLIEKQLGTFNIVTP